jgi:hypothetical protein
MMPDASGSGGEEPRRCAELRREGDHFVAVRVPEDVVVLPSGIWTPEGRTPIRWPLAWTLITDFNARTTPAVLNAALWLVAHKDNKFGAAAGLGT